MAESSPITMPSGMGGLMRYDAEYTSRFMVSPAMVIGFIIAIIAFAIIIRVFMPIGV